MLIYPAIDLQHGVAVRLALGDFDQSTQYGDPLTQLAAFARSGRGLDPRGRSGRAPRPVRRRSTTLLARMARATDMSIQCGGGVREKVHVEALLDAGVARVVIGSAAVKRPDEVRDWIKEFGAERICCAFDARPKHGDFEVAVHGWAEGGGVMLSDALALYPPGTLAHTLVTDISRDGVLTGSNVTMIAQLAAARPDLAVQASGGVASLADIPAQRAAGAAGVIIGRALYEKQFTLEQALAS